MLSVKINIVLCPIIFRSISDNMENKTTQQLIEELSQTISNLRQSLLGNRPVKSPEQVQQILPVHSFDKSHSY